MSYYMLAALITAAIGVVPLFLVRRYVSAGALYGVSFLVLWFTYWASVPSTIYPLWGLIGISAIILWVISAGIHCVQEQELEWTVWFPAMGFFALIASAVIGSGLFNASTYANMVGPIEERVWTEDVQPKDPRHMIMVSAATATYLAKKAIAQGGSIGSQFKVDTTNVRLQRVHGELVYVYPLDYDGFSVWWGGTGAPGYIIVYAEDQERTPRLVMLPQDKLMRYTPGAFWGNNLERYLRNSGFLNDGLTDFHLELDEQNNVHWVVTTYQLSAQWWGERVTGIAIIDPTTGATERYSMDKVPDWVDRVVPNKFVENYIDWRGEYSGGWLNSWWGKFNLTSAESPTLIYGQGDKAEFVTGVTSNNEKDDSLIGLMYTDSRTGKSVFYRLNGGATDTAILAAVNANAQVKFKHLRATTPQIYNVYGIPAAVVPLINDTGAYQAVAIVEVTNVQDVAVGESQTEALRNFQTLVARRGQQIVVEKGRNVKKLVGVVDRIAINIGPNGSVYYFHIAGAPRIFTASSEDHIKLPLTQQGDQVIVEYVASEQDTVPVTSFDNLSLPLDKSQMQHEVERAAQARVVAEEKHKTASEVTEQLKHLSPEQLKQIQEILRKQ